MSQGLSYNNLLEVAQFQASQKADETLFTFLNDQNADELRCDFKELDNQAKKIGGLLQDVGKKGQRAILLYPPGLDYIYGFFGCLYSGVIAVPAYPPDPNRLQRTLPRLLAIIQDCQADLILTTESIASMAEFLIDQAPELKKLKWIATDTVPADFIQGWKHPDVSLKTLAFLQYTSGSTGHPKGVMLSHGNLLHNLELIQNAFELDSRSVSVFWLPPYHDMGLIGGILEPLYHGGQMNLMSPISFLQRPLRWLEAITRFRATHSGGPNFAYELCLRKVSPEQATRLDLRSWSLAFSGAEPIRKETLDRFAQVFEPCGFSPNAFYPCYGLAEGTLIVTGGKKGNLPIVEKISKSALKKNRVFFGSSDTFSHHFIGCGQALGDQAMTIVNPSSLRGVPNEEVGEVWLSGGSVAEGYWNQPEATKETFKATTSDTGPGSYLRTGDLGFLKNGELFITGRFKDLIIIRGNNHYPQDIEIMVEGSHSALRQGCSAAFSIDVNQEERLVIVQEVEPSAYDIVTSNPESIISSIRSVIAEKHDLQVYAITLIKRGSIPKTSSGKIRRRACHDAFLSNSLEVLFESRSAGNELPELKTTHRKRIQEWLVDQFSQRLGIKYNEIDVNKPLSGYGLDSKDAINLSGEIEDYLGRSFSPNLLWKFPTIEALAQHLSSEEA